MQYLGFLMEDPNLVHDIMHTSLHAPVDDHDDHDTGVSGQRPRTPVGDH